MKQSPTFFAGRERPHAARTDLLWKMVASLPARVAGNDLRRARTIGPNVLLVGHDPQVADAATYLAGSAASAPLTMWSATDGLRLPREVTRDVVVARDVEALRPNEQQELLHWLTLASGEMRVISTASPALWPMVRDGAFSPELYYRLNTVCIRMS